MNVTTSMILLYFTGLAFIKSIYSIPQIIDIIITKRYDLASAQKCTDSILRSKFDVELIKPRIILVQSHIISDSLRLYEKSLCKIDKENFLCPDISYMTLIDSDFEVPLPYESKSSNYIILLQADAVVTHNWLTNLFNSITHKVAFVGPLSNLAGFQSVPYYEKNIELNQLDYSLPPGVDFNLVGKITEENVINNKKNNIEVTFLNSFCVMFSRNLIKVIGSLKGKKYVDIGFFIFDVSLLAQKNGFHNLIVSSSYVYHDFLRLTENEEKTKNSLLVSPKDFIHHNIISYSEKISLQSDYPIKRLLELEKKDLESIQQLNNLRNNITMVYKQHNNQFNKIKETKGSILFVLHDIAVAGGIISILQESLQMLRYGLNVSLAIPEIKGYEFSAQVISSILPNINKNELNNMIKLYSGSVLHPAPVSEDFINLAKNYDILIATHSLTAQTVGLVSEKYNNILPAYYVQDYEPWFFMNPFARMKYLRGSSISQFSYSRNSYVVNNKGIFMFAKTYWSVNMVEKNHDVKVHKVTPSLDHEMYYPDRTTFSQKFHKRWNSTIWESQEKTKFRIMAMIRPRTLRRNPLNTLEVLLKLAYNNPNNLIVTIFGCDGNNMYAALKSLVKTYGPAPYRTSNFVFHNPQIEQLGIVMERKQIADKYRQSDIFIDLSWWQAFGRSALEAMACGCISVMPLVGASSEMCNNGENCLYHDGNDVQGYYDTIMNVLKNDSFRYNLAKNGVEFTMKFTVEAAAASIADELQKGLINHRKKLL